ncbi:MAG: phenylalanine--tRNA ligase subunit beta [Clostridia bacterium]|nr:phenylalanine--tRNA ligase subunit beta [Clostridia bacterium]
MVSLNWVKDYIDLTGEEPKALAEKVTKAGINIEKVESDYIDKLIIGKIIECEAHPNSDHLHLCKVDVGNEILKIVCGAPNARKDLKVIVAMVGAKLPDGEIKAGKIRGEESNGMLCALYELGVEPKTEENYDKGIHEVEEEIQVGMDANLYLGKSDTLYDLDIHKHRNNDCYYHIGFAYEIGSIINKPVTLPEDTTSPINENVKDNITVEVETEKCPLYVAKMVKNVKIGESPKFIKERLQAVGMRSINNVVDISNYVMLEYGQPLHFFDKEKLGNKIVVRDAKDNEEIITLDEEKRVLSSNDIVITDGEKSVAIAGVMGGKNSDVDENTKNILIESAIFDSTSIRYTAAKLDLRSEASIRFGKGLNFEYTYKAIDRACHLLEKYAGGEVLTGEVAIDKIDKTPKKVIVKKEQINKLLGLEISADDMEKELKRIDFEYKREGETFDITIPNRRLDVDPNVNDIAEEIARLYGYHNLVSTMPKVETKRGIYVGDIKLRKEISKRLRTLGLNECKTYTLTSPEMAKTFNYEQREKINLPNPMGIDKSIFRTSLIPSLLNIYNYNKARKVKDVLLYEIAKTYQASYEEDTKVCMLLKGNYLLNDWKGSSKIDFYLVKGLVENLFDYLGLKGRYSFEKAEVEDMHPGMTAKILLDRKPIGIIGRVHPSNYKDEIFIAEFSLTRIYEKSIKLLKYKEVSKYPEIEKDLAFIVDKNVQSAEIENIIKRSGGRLLTKINAFDVYEGDNLEQGKKSICYNLTFQDETKTLTDNEVMEVFNKIIQMVEKNMDAKLRDK